MRTTAATTGLRALLLAPALAGVSGCVADDVDRSSEARTGPRDPVAVLRDSVPVIMDRADVPGLQLAYVESGRVAATAAFGTADAESGRPVTDRTIFEAASLSKPVFAYAVLRMAERGEWDLDRPLWEILEYERLAHDERAGELTTRMVLTHVTGLPNWGGTPLEFVADPGERWGYSGEGFVYLQKSVEARTGLTLEQIARREVFEPLGMSESHYVWIEAFDTLAAIPHDELGDPASRRKPETGSAAGSLHTTASDYARFVVAILGGEGLDSAMHAAMLEPGSDVTGSEWGDDAEVKSHIFWGLGLGLQEGRRGRSFWHWGDQGGTARCFVVAYPDEGDALVYFTNSANGLAIGPALLELAFDDDHWPLRWLDYGRYDDPARLARLGVTRTFLEEGPDDGMAAFEGARAEFPDLLTEDQVNSLGYVLLRRDAVEEAVRVFERNTVDFPESSNVWDSYGEGLRRAGRLEEAIQMYRKSIALDPSNANARRFVAEMEEEIAAPASPGRRGPPSPES
ncbi:MAG: serine hydrolase [Gemmatimonadota bacterium]